MSKSSPQPQPSERAVRDALVQIWRRIAGSDEVTEDSDWYDFLPGMRVWLLFEAIRTDLGIDLPYCLIYRDSKLADLAASIANGTVPATIRRVVPLRSGHSAPALVYVPGVFGEDAHAREALLALDHPVYFLRAPGLDEDEEPLHSLPDLAQYFLDGILPMVGTEPVVLAGFSSGGMIAIEMARRGEELGWQPGGVVLIDTIPPGTGFEDLEDEDLMAYRLQTILYHVANSASTRAPECLGQRLTEDKVAEITDFLYQHDSDDLPPGVPWSVLERRLRVYGSGMRATHSHTMAPCDVPVGYIRAAEGQDLAVDWKPAAGSRPYEVLDLDRTHANLWQDRKVAEAIAYFARRFYEDSPKDADK